VKKTLFLIGCLLSNFAFANSTISLPIPNGGNITPKGGSVAITLKGYGIDYVVYHVTCHIDAPDFMQVQILASGLNPTYTYLNGNVVGFCISRVVTLNAGKNTIYFDTMHSNDNTYDPMYNNFGFTNLDNSLTAKVTDCSISP
jgi:hypothetical protein